MEPIISREYDGKLRKLFPVACSNCGGTKLVPKNQVSSREFCSRGCLYAARRKGQQKLCGSCGTLFWRKTAHLQKSKSGIFFCTRACKERAQSLGGIAVLQHPRAGNGAATYRERARREKPAFCKGCGYDRDPRMLDVDHVDSDRKNNASENLQFLCVWCHALKTRGVDQHSRDSGMCVGTRSTPAKST